MPKLMGKDEHQTHQTLHGFQFSAAKVETLGASDYTIVTVVQDKSGSVSSFSTDMEATLQKIIEACQKSPRSQNLLIRLVTFNDDVQEVHGFVELNNINAGQYSGVLDKCYGSTALNDASLNSAEAIEAYGQQLSSMDFRSNAVMFVITDGQDNVSVVARDPAVLKKAFKKIKTSEIVESFQTVLVGVGTDPNIISDLKKFKDDAGFDQFVEMGAATPSKLAKLADFISKSISSTSQALGTGQPSQPLTF
jgi:uncharacterized protein YegL